MMKTFSFCVLSFSLGCALTALVLRPSAQSRQAGAAAASGQPESRADREHPSPGKDGAGNATAWPVGSADHPLSANNGTNPDFPSGAPATGNPGEHMARMMQATNQSIYRSKADKLAARLKLAPDQKEALLALMDSLALADSERNAKLMRVMIDKPNEPEALPSAIEDSDHSAHADAKQELQKWIDAHLNPEQQENLGRYREERRTANAEQYAQAQLTRMNEALDLDEGQRDRLFQHFARQALESGMASDDVFGNLGMDESTGENGGDNSPVQGAPDPLEQILNAGQYAAYRDFEKQEEQRSLEMLKAMGIDGALSNPDVMHGSGLAQPSR